MSSTPDVYEEDDSCVEGQQLRSRISTIHKASETAYAGYRREIITVPPTLQLRDVRTRAGGIRTYSKGGETNVATWGRDKGPVDEHLEMVI